MNTPVLLFHSRLCRLNTNSLAMRSMTNPDALRSASDVHFRAERGTGDRLSGRDRKPFRVIRPIANLVWRRSALVTWLIRNLRIALVGNNFASGAQRSPKAVR